MLQELLDELPPERLKSASEHVWKIAAIQHQALELLDKMLAERGLSITLDETIEPPVSADDLRGSLNRYLSERPTLLERLELLTGEQWLHQARHPRYCRFLVLLLIQRLTLIELHHVYQIGEILLAL
ncbi:MAG: hypothetical protein FJ286_18495 [Planctomycetes bacterium]|nr:hypothetical protein [Planctomycetota bacterium]